MAIHCEGCGSEATQEDLDEARISATLVEVWVCNGCRCDNCGRADKHAKTSDYAECRSCEENRNERAYERSLSDYYGSSSPQTLDEQCRAAWNLKEGR